MWNNSSQSEHTWCLIYSNVQHSLDQSDFSMSGATQCDAAGIETKQLIKYPCGYTLTKFILTRFSTLEMQVTSEMHR